MGVRARASNSAARFAICFGCAALLLLIGCAYGVLFCASARDISAHARGTDDAYVSYRYALNWVQGHGLVFNPGERVEGYTNLLYTLLMGVPFVFGWDVYHYSVTLNTGFALLTLALLVYKLRAELGERAAVIGAVLFALSPSIWIWVSSGLETPLILLLQVAIWISVDAIVKAPKDSARGSAPSLALCLAIALLILARADGFVSSALAVAYLFLKRRSVAGKRAAVTLVCVLSALFAWRIHYYHDLWPNTYYAKVSSTLAVRLKSSVKELGGICARQGLSIYLLAILLSAFEWLKSYRTGLASVVERLSFGPFFGVCWLGYWLYVGGDNFEDRFLIVLIPIGIAQLLALALEQASGAVQTLIVAVALLVQLSVPVRDDQFGKTPHARYDRLIAMGKFLGQRQPGRVVATAAAGKIPFYSGLKTIDMLGLTDAHISHLKPVEFIPGHSKFDADYVLSRRPDLITGRLLDGSLDMGLGLTESKYRNAGYRIRYLANSSNVSRGDDVIDLLGRSDETILALSNQGWSDGILELSQR